MRFEKLHCCFSVCTAKALWVFLGAFFLPGIGMLHGVSVFVDDGVRVCVRFRWNTHYRVLHSSRLGWRIVLLDTYVA